ncbi:UNVERIFIED_CONTAM: hypothetical protein FKN15_019576 [Acipenser sinensis]
MQSAGETMAAKPGLVYLVTGGCGFLGQHVFRMLLEKEDNVAEVRLFDLAVDDSLANLSTGNVAWMHLLAARMIREKPEVVGGQVYFCYDDSHCCDSYIHTCNSQEI